MFSNISSFVKNKPAFSVGFLFSVSSLVFGIWVAAIPTVKHHLDLTDAALGLSLLLSPLGAITGMLLSTRVFSKLSVGKWMANGYIIICLLMILQINSVNRLMFWACLYLYGLVSFLNGVSANATVNMLEKKQNRFLMSTCHAMYSLGGAVSAGLAILMFSLEIRVGWQIEIVALVIIIVLLLTRKLLLANNEIIHHKSKLKLPSSTILGISFICMVVFMAEGCVADWSALYFREVLETRGRFVSLGYAGFAIAMTAGRFNGDTIIKHTGSKKLVIAGSLLAATGFLLVSFAHSVPLAVTGFILIGIGCSGIVPVLFRASANIPGVSTVEGFAMVTTGGLIGFLTGPSVIGIISEKTNLAVAFLLPAVMAIAAAFMAWRNKFLGSNEKGGGSAANEHEMYVTDQ